MGDKLCLYCRKMLRRNDDHICGNCFSPTPPACVVTEGEIEKVANYLWATIHGTSADPVTTIKHALRILIHRAGGRVVTKKLILKATYDALEKIHGPTSAEQMEHEAPINNYIADAILTAIAGEGE